MFVPWQGVCARGLDGRVDVIRRLSLPCGPVFASARFFYYVGHYAFVMIMCRPCTSESFLFLCPLINTTG